MNIAVTGDKGALGQEIIQSLNIFQKSFPSYRATQNMNENVNQILQRS